MNDVKKRFDALSIFNPIVECGPSDRIFIATYGLGTVDHMRPVIDRLSTNARYLLVGYSKNTYPTNLILTLKAYKNLGWHVKVLPGCHLKLWVVGSKAYVGSCNFVQNTMVNCMWNVDTLRASTIFRFYWNKAATLSRSTDLMLLPQTSGKTFEVL